MSKFYVQYISGIDRQPVPKPINVNVERDGIKVFKHLIRWQDMTSVTTSANAAGNSFSVGRAIAGDMLAGGIGAMGGGMSGKQKFNTFVQISYKVGGKTNVLVLMPKGNIKVQEKFINKLIDNHGKLPATPSSFREEMHAITAEGKAQRQRQGEAHRERMAELKQRRQERNERQKEQLKTLAAVPGKLLAKLRQK